MAPRWIKTQDRKPSPFPSKGDDDWVLVSGDLLVGRVFRESGGTIAGRVVWLLTVAGGPIAAKGGSDSIENAQKDLLASWRAWQEWAGMRDVE